MESKMFLLFEDSSGCRRVGGTKEVVDDFFCGGIRFKEGDLEIFLDDKKRMMVEVSREGVNRSVLDSFFCRIRNMSKGNETSKRFVLTRDIYH